MKTRWPEAAASYQADAARNEMSVLHDDGLYRHIMFRNPATSLYWFNLTTWPGSLCFSGDVGTWVFRRLDDMIRFFADSNYGDINPGYWGEKVTAGEVYEPWGPEAPFDPDPVREFGFQFLWACFAIRDGVNRYQHLKNPQVRLLRPFTVPVSGLRSPARFMETVQPSERYL